MFIRLFLALALTLASLTGFARTSDLSVRLDLADRANQTDQQVIVDVTFTNIGALPITMVKWFVPDGELEGDYFFLSRNGQPMSYLGPIIKRPAITAQDLVTLAPGESITGSVDISLYYDFSRTGIYAMQYGVTAGQIFAHDPRAAIKLRSERDSEPAFASEVLSNHASAFVEGRRNAMADYLERRTSQLKAGSISFAGRCSASQMSTIQSAVSASQVMANDSVSYLSGAPAATPRFTTWFGTYSSANWNEVKGHYVNIKDALDNKPLTFDCGCNKKYYAYVFPTQPYTVYLCRAFWNAPLTGTDSKGGTIIHELSHFNVVAGTDDFAYGQTAAKQLALTNPAQARANADSHEYFAENTPTLP